MSEASQNETLDWHRQAANWVVVVSAGAIGFMWTMLKDCPHLNWWQKGLFLASSLLFFVSIISGTLVYFGVVTLAQRRRDLAEAVSSRRASTDAKTPSAGEQQAMERVTATRKDLSKYYLRMLSGFGAGATVLGAFIVVCTIRFCPEDKSQKHYSLVTGPSLTNVLFMLEEHTGKVWRLEQNTNGVMQWLYIGLSRNASKNKKGDPAICKEHMIHFAP